MSFLWFVGSPSQDGPHGIPGQAPRPNAFKNGGSGMDLLLCCYMYVCHTLWRHVVDVLRISWTTHWWHLMLRLSKQINVENTGTSMANSIIGKLGSLEPTWRSFLGVSILITKVFDQGGNLRWMPPRCFPHVSRCLQMLDTCHPGCLPEQASKTS